MKKQIFSAIVLLPILFFLISCEEKTSQEDVLKEQQIIDLVLYVMDASQEDAPLDSAVVRIQNGDDDHTAVTDESGMALFEEVQISDQIPFSIKKTGYTNVSSTVGGNPNNYRQHQISQVVELYPLTGDSVLATIQGRLTIETDVTNREKEAVPAGTPVKAYNYALWNDVAFYGETDADGNYEIKVPVAYDGNDNIDLVYPEIYTSQSLALRQDDGSIAVEERMAYFNLQENAENSAIPSIPSVYATVNEPGNDIVGSGFSLGSEPIPAPMTSIGAAIIIRGGSGYDDGNDQLIDLSPGINGNVAQLQVDIDGGRIINVDGFVNNSALYTSKPSINTNVLNGGGASIEILFQPSWNVYIEDNGSGYVTFPVVYGTIYQYGPDANIVEDIDDVDLSTMTNLINGQIINDDPTDGDTIVSGPSAMAPEFEIINTSTSPAMVSFDENDVSTAGQIINMNVDEAGYGYDPSNPPAMNIMSVAGYGEGAEIRLSLDNEGVINSFNIINQGTGYVKNVNDFRDDGTTSDDEADPTLSTGTSMSNFTNINDVSPGKTFIRSAHYGTGTPEDDQ